MDVLGHHHVADHVEPVAAPGLFERAFENVLRVVCVEERLPTITTEGDEVETLRLLEPDESPRHVKRLRCL